MNLEKVNSGHLPLSRATLQTLHVDRDYINRKCDIHNHISRIHNDIINQAKMGKTSYIYNMLHSGYHSEPFSTEFKEALAVTFPNCKTDYVDKGV